MAKPINTSLQEYVPGQIWLKKYPVRYAGCDLFARTTFVRLSNGELWVHSPGPVNDTVNGEVQALGDPAHLVAPGNFHHMHVASWQTAFPQASTWICPGVERKQKNLKFNEVLSDQAPEAWNGEFEQIIIRGSWIMWEVAFVHRASRTLILTDLIENIGPDTEGSSWALMFWWKLLRMWGTSKPAPEYQLGWRNRAQAKECLERILAWDFQRVVIAHGENLEGDVKATLRTAWSKPLGH